MFIFPGTVSFYDAMKLFKPIFAEVYMAKVPNGTSRGRHHIHTNRRNVKK